MNERRNEKERKASSRVYNKDIMYRSAVNKCQSFIIIF